MFSWWVILCGQSSWCFDYNLVTESDTKPRKPLRIMLNSWYFLSFSLFNLRDLSMIDRFLGNFWSKSGFFLTKNRSFPEMIISKNHFWKWSKYWILIEITDHFQKWSDRSFLDLIGVWLFWSIDHFFFDRTAIFATEIKNFNRDPKISRKPFT